MQKTTIVPRPGVFCTINLVYKTDIDVSTLGEMKIAGMQSAINERFAEPQKLGTVSTTFRSEVDVRHGILIVSTDTSFLPSEAMEEIHIIVDEHMSGRVEFDNVTTEMRRKSLPTDFL